MTSEISLFVNPTAGLGRGAHAAQPAASALRAAGFSVRTILGADADDALRRARQAVADGTGALVAVGGDGMVHLALQAVAGTTTPLGVVAVGTGNDFARSLGLPVRDAAAGGRLVAEALKGASTRQVDLGRVGPMVDPPRHEPSSCQRPLPVPMVDPPRHEPSSCQRPLPVSMVDPPRHEPRSCQRPLSGGRWFGTVLASGFDSRVNDRGNRMRWPTGRLKYDLAMVAELAAFRPLPYRITLDDGGVREVEATLVAVGNGPSYGGGMRICAGAELTDGLFDVTVVGDCSRATLLRVFPRVYTGTHLQHPKVSSHRAAKVEVAAPEVTAYADGERLGALPLLVECVPAAVRVLVPSTVPS